MRSKRPLIVVVIVLAAALGGGAWWLQGRPSPEEAGRLRLYGNADLRQVQLAFQASGRIASLAVQEGERVRTGQSLGQLDDRRLRQALDQAEARVAAQRQVLARLVAGSRPEEIAKARADLALARAQLANAEQTLKRVRDLSRRELASAQQLDDAQAGLDVARARVAAAQAGLDLALAGARDEDIAAARAELAAARAAAALARTRLDDAELVAPSDGVIQNRLLQVGDMAGPQAPVYTLALTQPIWVRAYVGEPDLGRLHLGMPAEVSTDSAPERRLPGWVGFISPTAQFTPKSVETPRLRTELVYEVRVLLCNADDALRLGMPATVHIDPARADEDGVQDCSAGPAGTAHG